MNRRLVETDFSLVEIAFMIGFSEQSAFADMVSAGQITYVQAPHNTFVTEVANSGAPKDVVWILDYLFSTVLDGRNAYLSNGIQRALGRPPKDFADYAHEAAATGIWKQIHTFRQH